MSKKAKVLSGSALLAGSRILQKILAFARNVLVARLVLPEDFGLAATFWLTTSFLRTITELGLEQWIIHEKDGDSDEAGAVLQSLFLIRGIALSLILVVLAEPIAYFFNALEATWAFRCLALLPLLQGLQHRDVERVKRHLRFGPSVTATLVPEVLVTIATLPIALITRDYRVFLITAILSAFLTLVISHLIAESKFRFGWSKAYLFSCFSFGWPLLVNSVLIYFAMQGDRVLLAQYYSKAELGAYSIAAAFIVSTIGMTVSIINPIVFPLMSGVRDDPKLFEKYFRLHVAVVTAAALCFGIGLIALGPQAIDLFYGEKYAGAELVIGWLAMAEALRLLRGPAMNVAMSKGDTKNTMFSNMVRLVGFAIATYFAINGFSIPWIAISCVIGEVLSLIATVLLLKVRHPVNVQPIVKSIALLSVALTLSALFASKVDLANQSAMTVLGVLVLLLFTGVAFCVMFPEAYREAAAAFFKSLAICRHPVWLKMTNSTPKD